MESIEPVAPLDVEFDWHPIKQAYFEGFNDGATRLPTDDGSFQWENSNAISHTRAEPSLDVAPVALRKALASVTYENREGWHVFSSEDQPGFYVASKELWKAAADVVPAMALLLKLDAGTGAAPQAASALREALRELVELKVMKEQMDSLAAQAKSSGAP